MSKLILMGTPAFVVPIFEDLRKHHEIIAVFTRKPKPTGRKLVLTKTPVHEWAESHNIPVHTNIKDFDNIAGSNSPSLATRNVRVDISAVATAGCPKGGVVDYIIVAAYGVILKDNVLNAAPCVNVHPSDLPKYRGPTPISTAILNGDAESAICIMEMVNEVDAGAVYMREKFEIGENDTTDDIEKLVSRRAGPMLLEYLKAPDAHPPVPQTGTPTFTQKITTADTEIDWKKSPCEIHNQIRAIGGKTQINGIDCKIIKTHLFDDTKEKSDGTVKNGDLVIDIIQPSGKRPMPMRDFLNGHKNAL